MNKHLRAKNSMALALAGTLAGFMMVAGTALATVTVSVPANGNISADTANSGSVALPALTLTEGSAGDIGVGTLTWVLPSGYQFDTASSSDVLYSGGGLAGSATIAFPDSTHFSLTISATSTAAGSLTIGGQTPLKIKVSNSTPLAASGMITLSSGTLPGLTATSSFGSLSQIPGAAAKLAFIVQPPATVLAGSAFSATVGVQDQFGNLVTGDSNRTVTLMSTNASSTLGGTTTTHDTSGLAVFSNLTLAAAPSALQLSATATPLTGALSNTINVTAVQPTSTPPAVNCGLKNGSLVKVEGGSTVYMVINCVLRPFTTPAIFHARGKKFEDVHSIPGDEFKHLGVGKNIGDGNDDDSTILIPPQFSASTTPGTVLPSAAGLPDGTVVKLPNNPTVYLVSNGQLQPFTSLTIFNLHGKKFSQVQTITPEQFSQLAVGAPVGPPDGTLVKGSNSTVFIIKNGKKLGIPNMTVLKQHGYSLNGLVKLDDGDLNNLPDGGTEN